MGIFFRFNVLSAALLTFSVSFASDADEWEFLGDEPRLPRPHIRRALDFTRIASAIPSSSVAEIEPTLSLNTTRQDSVHPVASSSTPPLPDDTEQAPTQTTPVPSLKIAFPVALVTQALESPPIPIRHKRVEMLRSGEDEVSFETRDRHKRIRDAREASTQNDVVPIPHIIHPSKHLDAKACREMACRMYQESLNPRNPALLAIELLERAKAYALSVIIRDPQNVTEDDLEIAADLLFETCDYKWAATFYERSIAKDLARPRETYARLIHCYEELGDFEDAHKAAEKLVQHAPDALRSDKHKLKALWKEVNKDRLSQPHGQAQEPRDTTPSEQGASL